MRHVYGTLRAMLNDAVAHELIPSSPCVLNDELPAKRDKDRTWRRTAVFTRDEVEAIISAESTPDDRRVLASLMFLGAMRFGEAAALTWRDYDPTCAPLGKLVIEKSYSTKKRKVKGTKTDNPREMPVHPTLARILARWKLSGFERLTGRKPRPEDPIVPSRRGAYRNVNASLRRFHEDLERIGLRARGHHDARRTFISIARADGAVADTLHFATHGPDGDIMDDYTTMPWPALCAEVAKVRISLREGKLLEMPMPVAAGGGSALAAPFAAVLEPAVMTRESWRSGHGHGELLLVGVLARVRREQVLQGSGSSRVVDHLCDRGCGDGFLVPALQLLQVFLGHDALARGFRDGDATNAKNGEHGIRLRFGARLGFPFFPALQHGHDELLLVGVLARVRREQVLQGSGSSRVVDHLCDRGCG
ncbi:MAG TPA: hypothetical protein VF488_13850, partial [Gemmatimonadaceae bacterium]